MFTFSGLKKSSICIDCAKCEAKCSWSSRFVPVEGWEAEYVEGGPNRLPSYCVISCPEFEKDRETPKTSYVPTRSELFYKMLISGGKDDDKTGL